MPSNDFYSAGSFRTEVNLRQELENFLDGAFPEIAKKQKALLRKMRRDSDGTLVSCACVDATTGEADKDTFCPLCHGESWYWSEVWLDVYRIVLRSDVGNAFKERLLPATTQNIPVTLFFARYSAEITEDDRIIEMKLNADGTVYRPYTRQAVYRIGTLFDMRSDNGKLEYWKIATFKEERKFLNGPNG
jgi:hypothetical protein